MGWLGSLLSAYVARLSRLTPGLPPWEAAYEFLPWLFRWIAFLLILPVLILLAADLTTYLYFRAVYQPFGRARTAFYKAGPQRWRSRPQSKQGSPRLDTSKLSKESTSSVSSGRLRPPDATSAGQRTPSVNNARTQGLGVDGPMLDPHSPSMESEIPLPDIDEEEDTYFGGS